MVGMTFTNPWNPDSYLALKVIFIRRPGLQLQHGGQHHVDRLEVAHHQHRQREVGEKRGWPGLIIFTFRVIWYRLYLPDEAVRPGPAPHCGHERPHPPVRLGPEMQQAGHVQPAARAHRQVALQPHQLCSTVQYSTIKSTAPCVCI